MSLSSTGQLPKQHLNVGLLTKQDIGLGVPENRGHVINETRIRKQNGGLGGFKKPDDGFKVHKKLCI
jgi:hypothetical protein